MTTEKNLPVRISRRQRFWYLLVGMVIPLLVGYNLSVQVFPSQTGFQVESGEQFLGYQQIPVPEEMPRGKLFWYYYNQTQQGPFPLRIFGGERSWRVYSPGMTLAEVSPLAVNLTNLVVLLFWVGSVLLLWRRFDQRAIQLLFLLGQVMGLTLLYPLAHEPVWAPPLLLMGLKFLGYFLIAAFFLHYVLVYPVPLGTDRSRSWGMGVVYASVAGSFLGWLAGGVTGWRVGATGSFLVALAAVGVMIYSYHRLASPRDRRRLRVILVGSLFAGLPPILLYMLPAAVGASWFMPEWIVSIFLLTAPVSYLYATARHNLFGIDRLLNRALVYGILTLGIFLLYLGPVLLLYQRLPENQLLQITIISGVTLLVGWSFDWARDQVQRFVDRVFYGGWYDYPGVVETISEALAGSLEREQIRDVLTRQVPVLMQLSGAHLWIGESNATYPQMPSMPERFRFKFHSDVPAQWTVGDHRDGSDLNTTDLRILNTLARQAEVALNNVLLVETLRQQLQEIQASRETLSQAQHQLLRSREEERARLARDLHDGPIQSLVGLNIQLGLMVSSAGTDLPLTEGLGEMRGEVRELLSELRQVCAELRPPMLDALGLGAALNAYAEEWCDQCGVKTVLKVPPNAELQDLPEEVAVNLYRVTQEALTNVARHAGAETVSLTLERLGERVMVVIEDDGRGFTPPETLHDLPAENHFGMVGMRERIELIGGEWQVESEEGRGTRVEVIWPKE